jgi:hypothetical protein
MPRAFMMMPGVPENFHPDRNLIACGKRFLYAVATSLKGFTKDVLRIGRTMHPELVDVFKKA